MPSVAGLTTTDYNGWLKRSYIPKWKETFNQKVPCYDAIIKTLKNYQYDGETGGLRWIVDSTRSWSGGARNAHEAVPSGFELPADQASEYIKRLYFTADIDGMALDAGKSSAGGVGAALTRAMKKCDEQARYYFGVNMYGFHSNSTATSSLNGVRAKVVSVAGGTVITLKDPLGYVQGTDVPSIGAGRYLSVGARIVWGTRTELANNTVPAGAFGRVTSVNHANQTVTLTAAPGHAPVLDDFIVLGNAPAEHEFNKTIGGLGTLVKQGAGDGAGSTIHGLSLSSGDFTKWATLTKDVNGPFAMDDLHKLIRNVEALSGGEARLLVADETFYSEFQSSLINDVRFEPEKLKGGYEIPTFLSMGKRFKLHMDSLAPYGTVFALDRDNMFWIKQRELGWDDRGGSVLRQKEGQDDYHVRLTAYIQFAFMLINAHAVMKRVTISDAPYSI